MKDLILIQPPASFENTKSILPQNEVGIGMLTIMAYAKKQGYTGEVIHIPRALEAGYTMENIMERIEEAQPKVIGIGLNWLHFSEGMMQLANMLRKLYPNTCIVTGGQHATLFASEILEACEALDAVTIGEAEKTYCYLLEKLERGWHTIDEVIPGIMIKHSTKGIISQMPEIVKEIDELPFYTYQDVWPNSLEICAALDTVRGECIKECSYCIESKTNSLQGRKKFTQHSPKYLANQIERFVKEGIHNITIQDPYSFVGDTKIKQMCSYLKEKRIKLDHLNIFVEPRVFSEDTFVMLKEVADKVSLDYGMETGHIKTAEIIGRSYNRQEILDNIEMAATLGIKVLTWWMTGLPNDNLDTLKEGMEYIEETIKRGALPRWITPLILFPHTEMAKHNSYYGVKPHIRTFKEFCVYSTTIINNYGVYPELLTHETSTQNKREIVETTIALKKAIITTIGKYYEELMEYGWREYELKSIQGEARESFY